MNVGDLVLVSCSDPREKFWGVLEALTVAGVTVRGVRLETFDDWVRQCAGDGPRLLGPVTVFLPAHRIERIELDENSGIAEGMGEKFVRVTGREPRQELARRDQAAPPERDAKKPT